MRMKIRILAGGIGVLICILLAATNVHASWGISVESKAVAACPYEWPLDISASWDLGLSGLTIPIVVREIDAGSFWAPPLPVDTLNGSAVGVEWRLPLDPFAEHILELRPVVPFAPCDATGDVGYDGVSPDHFVINVSIIGSCPPQPAGYAIVTLNLWNTLAAGVFVFDTACATGVLHTIYMVDDQFPPVDHGPSGTGEATFTMGVVTVAPNGCPYPFGAYIESVVSGQEQEALANSHNGVYGDPEGDPPRFYQIAGPGTVDEFSGAWSWTPACGDTGEYSVEVEVADEAHCGGGICGTIISFAVEVACGCCNCVETFGDLDCDDTITPLDVSYIVNCVYLSRCEMCLPEDRCCPTELGDVDCNESMDPIDVAFYVNYVYLDKTPFPCSPCE
ncbi:hypothetical protein ACFLQW_00055 [Candidatus Zixiibacteriota bacterium]